MIRTLGRLVMAVTCLLVTSGVLAGGNANLIVGTRAFNEDDWAPVEDQTFFGVDVDFGKTALHYKVSIYSSSEDETIFEPFLGDFRFELETLEFGFGAGMIWGAEKTTRPFVGGGLSYITADVLGSAMGRTLKESDSALGLYIDGGVFWQVGGGFNIGLGGRFLLGTDVRVFDVDVDVDYFQFGVIIGGGW